MAHPGPRLPPHRARRATRNRIWRIGLQWIAGYDANAFDGIAEYSRRFGPFHFHYLTATGEDYDRGTIDQVVASDGIILYGSEGLRPLRKEDWPRKVPIVSLEGYRSRLTRWQVRPDQVAVGRLAARDFIERHFKHFGYCPSGESAPGQPMPDWDQERLDGFAAAVREAGGKPMIYAGEWQSPRSPQWEWRGPLAHWLQSLPKPIGILAAGDPRARQLLLAAEVSAINVPEEVAVIGVGNSEWVDIASPSLSSIELDGFRSGYAAMEMLHQRMIGQPLPPRILSIPPRRLITRRSSNVLAIDDPEVAAAVRFVAENATAGIAVRHVVEEVAVSRRSLECRFRAALHRSILQEIRSVQIQRAKLLLADKSIPLPRIAAACGFRSAKALGAIFHRMTGTTPSAFRRSLAQC